MGVHEALKPSSRHAESEDDGVAQITFPARDHISLHVPRLHVPHVAHGVIDSVGVIEGAMDRRDLIAQDIEEGGPLRGNEHSRPDGVEEVAKGPDGHPGHASVDRRPSRTVDPAAVMNDATDRHVRSVRARGAMVI